MIPAELQNIVESTPDTLGGSLRFAGTRVHVKTLFDYVLGSGTLEEFLEDFEGVSRDQAEAVLEWERKRIDAALAFGRAS